jgi:hypothetical protein
LSTSFLVEPCPIAEQIGPTDGLDHHVQDLIDSVERIRAKPDLVSRRIRYLLDQPDRLASLARRSYWHHNGFAKVKFVERGDRCLRLHIWPAGSGRLGELDPHGHRWQFASWVAVGAGVTEHKFVRTTAAHPDAVEYARFDYDPTTGAVPRRLPAPAWLRETGHRRWDRGEVYECERDVLHTVTPAGDELVATVVLQGPVVARSTSVYRRDAWGTDTRERRIAVDELRNLFGAVEAAIGGIDQR